MKKVCWFVLLLWVALATSAVAKARVTAAAVDDKGTARLHLVQPQIFDEIGGTAHATLDVANNLAVLLSELTLPEEAGDINGQSFISTARQALSAVGDFTYLPLKRKQLALEIDYHSVEDEEHSSGVNTFSVGYPLAAEHVSARTAKTLAHTSVSVSGDATWSHYTEAAAKMAITVQDPTYSRAGLDWRSFELRLTNHETTQLELIFDVLPGTRTAQMLSNPQYVQYIAQNVLSIMGISYGDVRVTPASRVSGAIHVEIGMTLYNVRQKIADDQAMMLRYARFPGVPRNAVAAALSTMYEVTPHDLDIKVRLRKDHYEISVDGSAGKVDKCIEGYLRYREIFDPAVVKAHTHNQNLSQFVANLNAVRTKRFRDVVVAAASSDDAGRCDFKFKLGFPHQRMALSATLKYDNLLKAYTFAYNMMKLPVLHQAYSRLLVHTTPTGLNGHFLYEVQGPWVESEWSLCSTAALAEADLHKLFVAEDPPLVDDGHVLVELKKSHLSTHGWIKFADLAAFITPLLPKNATARPQGVDAGYDADKEPGVIGLDLFVSNPDKSAAEKLVAQLAANVKPTASAALAAPQPPQPKVEIPPALAAEIEADRKFLGVQPWKGPAAVARAAARRSLLPLVAATLLIVLAGGALWFGQRRKAEMLGRVPQRSGPAPPPRAANAPPPSFNAAPPPPENGTTSTSPEVVEVSKVDEAEEFKSEIQQRLREAYPAYSIRAKEHFEVYVVKDGIPHLLDLEPLYFLTKKPGVDRDRAIQSFVKTLPNLH